MPERGRGRGLPDRHPKGGQLRNAPRAGRARLAPKIPRFFSPVNNKVYYDQQGNPIAIDFGVADIDGDTVDELIFTAGRKCPPCGGAPEPPDRLAGRVPAER